MLIVTFIAEMVEGPIFDILLVELNYDSDNESRKKASDPSHFSFDEDFL